MQASSAKGFGAAAVLGALLSVATSVPSRWFGGPETDAFLFNPAVFSPLWIERTLVPATSVLAGALVLAGVAGLVARDRDVAGRARRWGGYVTVAGLAMLEVTLVAFAIGMGASRGGSELVTVVFVLGGTVVGLLAGLLLVPGMLTVGVGYARTERPTVGYALLGGLGLSVLSTVAVSFLDPATGLGFLPTVVPFAAAIGVVGWELWTHPEPLEPPEDGEDAEATADAGQSAEEPEATPEQPNEAPDEGTEVPQEADEPPREPSGSTRQGE